MKKFNKIMGSFNKVVNKLEALSSQKRAEKKAFLGEIKTIECLVVSVEAEEQASAEVAAKLKALFTSSTGRSTLEA